MEATKLLSFQRNPIVKSTFLSGWWEPPPPLLRHLAIAHDCSSLSAAQLCIYIYIYIYHP